MVPMRIYPVISGGYAITSGRFWAAAPLGRASDTTAICSRMSAPRTTMGRGRSDISTPYALGPRPLPEDGLTSRHQSHATHENCGIRGGEEERHRQKPVLAERCAPQPPAGESGRVEGRLCGEYDPVYRLRRDNAPVDRDEQ